MTADAIIRIKIDANTGEARVIKRDLDNLGKSGDKVAASSDKMRRSFGLLRTALISLGGAFSIQQFSRLADTITNINTKLGNVTSTAQEFNTAFNDLFEVAQRTGTAFTATVDTFNRLNTALPESISQTRDLTKTVELLNKGFAASGTEAAAARGAITQLTQGLASDFQASAQEINSLIDAAPLLAKVIAEQLGGNAAVDLKRFAEAGTLTAESFLDALEKAEAAINAFEIPPTIERAVIRLKNEFLLLASKSTTLEESSRKLAGAINTLANNLDTVVKSVQALSGVLIPALTIAIGRGLVGAVVALTVAVRANPLFLGVSILSGAITAVNAFKDDIFVLRDELTTFGDVVMIVFDDVEKVINRVSDSLTVPIEKIKDFFNVVDDKNTREIRALILELNQGNAPNGVFENVLGRAQQRARDRQIQSQFTLGGRNQQIVESGLDFGDLNIFSKNPIPEQAQEVNNAIDKVADKIDSVNKNEIAETQNAFNDLTLQIERDLAGAFKSAFTKSENGFDGFVDGLKSTFKNFIAEIAFQASKPIFLNLVAGVAGGVAGSASNPALAAIGGGGGGAGGGIGNIGNLLSLGKNALSGLNAPIFSAGSAIGGGINSIGASLGLTNANFIGPLAPGTSSLASAFTPAAGIAGFGGNLLANAIFGGDRGIGSSIGGIAGGIGGTAVGASLGTILGFAGGPVGALIGAFAGNALGGLFGGGSTPSGAANTNVSFSNGQFSTRSSSDEATKEAIDQLKDVADQTINSLLAFSQQTGLEFNDVPNFKLARSAKRGGDLIRFGVGNNIRPDLEIRGPAIRNEEDLQNLIGQILQQSSFSNASNNVLKAIEGSTSSSILENVQIAQLIDSFEKAGEASRPLKDALDSLDSQFEDLRTKALALGLPVNELAIAYEKQKDALITGALKPLQDFLDSQALSGQSSLSAVDRLGLARSAFDQNLSSIQGGDFTNLNELTSQAGQLLSIGRDVFASGEGFNALESFVRQSVAGVAGDLGADGALNDSITRDIAISNAEQTSILQQVNVEIQQLREENRKLRKSMERIGNAVVTMTS